MTPTIDPKVGLTSAEVAKKTASGAHNTPMKPLTSSVSQIIKNNTLTLFNFVNLALGALIFTTGSYKNLLFLGVAIVNTAIGTFQEIRAKRKIDAMSILAQGDIQVMRDGVEKSVPQEELVIDDIVLLHRGDQIPVDGVVAATNGVEVDESPLTGESEPITKPLGAKLSSGSFIVSGQVAMHTTAVGDDTFAAKLALEAKSGEDTRSQLLATINRIIRVLTYCLIPLGVALFTISMVRRGVYTRAVLSTSAAVIGMIPEGLVLLTNVALAVSARNLALKRVLVRALPAIEALARVDVICLDKTGTITSGALTVQQVHPLNGATEAAVMHAAALVVYALDDDNETAKAIKAATPDYQSTPAQATVPFSSARKWSGATFDQESFAIGAPQFLFKEAVPEAAQAVIDDATNQGLRVIAVAQTTASLPAAPAELTLLGLILIGDQLRPTAKATFRFFESQDVRLKVISGDDPATVAAVAKKADLAGAEHYVDMSTIDDATVDWQQLAESHTVFGRVTPDQKKRLIQALQQVGHTVAMTGDGVNDVLALRQSDCAIAMASGAEAAKSIADFVLLDSNFDAMTGVLNEGRRVINNIGRVASMYLVKTIFSLILTACFIFLPADYPITPINLTPVSALAVAIPSFFLTLEPNFRRVTGQFMQKVMTIAAPAAIAVVLYTLVLMGGQTILGWSFEQTSTMVVLMIAVIECHVLFLVSRPLNRYKVFMLALVLVALFVTFFIAFDLFSLANLWRFDLLLVSGVLIASSFPVYFSLQEFLGKRVLARINWQY